MLNSMKTIKLNFLLIVTIFYSMVIGSCNFQDEKIQIPETVFGRLNITKRNLNVNLDLSVNDKQESRLFYESNLSFEYQVIDSKEEIKLDASIEKNRLRSMLYYKKDELEWIEVSRFEIDLQEGYKGKMNILIEKHSNTLKKKFDASMINRLANIVEGLPELLNNELGQKEYNDESALSIFYHLAAFNTVRRSYEIHRSSDCQCEINPNYVSGLSPFFCEEDIMVSADWAFDFIKEKSEIKKSLGYQFHPKKMFSYLSRESGRLVSVSTIDKLLRDELQVFLSQLNVKERQQIINKNFTLSNMPSLKSGYESGDGELDLVGIQCWLLGIVWGSDCGCCGHPDGFCVFCFVECYLHDIQCENCTPSWYCLPGCVPGACT